MKNRKISILAIILAMLVVLFTACNSGNKPAEETTTIPQEETTVYEDETIVNFEEKETEVVSEVVTNEEGETEIITEIVTKEEEKTTKKTEKETEKSTQAKVYTTEEIVALFNESANKIKTDATKVVKNYEKRITNRDKTVIPAAVEGMAEDMLSSLMKDDEKPSVYATREDIVNNYLVPEQNYVSKLQAKDVAKATIKDTGSTYEIYLKLKNQTNPTAGVGVGSVCDVIEAHEVAEDAPFVDKFTTDYYNCEVKATIDKATGKVVHTTYRTPLVLNITVSMFGKHDISAGFTFEKDYDITY